MAPPDFTRHLLIDAYNVIHHWPETKRALRRGSQEAREILAGAVRVIHDRERVRVTLVFDGNGPEITIERPGAQTTFSYLFSPASMSADDVIEQIVGKSADPGSFLVVTQDLAERRTVEALGGVVISPEDLRGWVDRVREAVARDLFLRRKDVEAKWNEGKGLFDAG